MASLLLAASASAATPAWELTLLHGPTNVPIKPSVNAQFTLTVNAKRGAYTLSFENPFTEEYAETGSIKSAATPEQVQEKLEKDSAIGKGNVRVTGGPGDIGATKPYVVEFIGAFAGVNLEEHALGVEEQELELPGEEEGTVSAVRTQAGYHDVVDYKVIARNLSAAPTSGIVTATVTLPPGLTTRETPEGEGWKCSEGVGQSTITCTAEGLTAPVANPDGDAQLINVEADVSTASPEPSPVSEGQTLEARATVSGGGAARGAEATDVARVSNTPAPFGLQSKGFVAATYGEGGEAFTQAGGHPYAATTTFFFNTDVAGEQVTVPDNVKDTYVRLPEGFVGNPQATGVTNAKGEVEVKRCSQAEFTQGIPGGQGESGTICPAGTQIGTAVVLDRQFGHVLGENESPANVVPLYNLQPPPGVPAEFGFIFSNVPVRIDAHVIRESGPNGTYRVTVLSPDINEAYPIFGASLTLWGDPSDESHKAERVAGENESIRGAPAEGPKRAFLTAPTGCVNNASRPPTTTISADPWHQPGQLDSEGAPVAGDPNWSTVEYASPPVTGCQSLAFDPKIGFEPRVGSGGTTQVDEPSGYKFELNVPNEEYEKGEVTPLASPELQAASVKLPQGVSLSPSAANGLQACTTAEIGLESTAPGGCPAASQIGTVSIKSQLLAEPLSGRLYVGEPECSPCSSADAEQGRLFKLFIEAEGSGVRVKLPGSATVNVATGQLTTTFANNPQLPFEKLVLALNNGARAPLANPQSCGGYATSAALTPWSLAGTGPLGETIQGTPVADVTAPSFTIGGCSGSAPFNPGFHAGTEVTKAGEYTNFQATFTRNDGEQDLSGITVQTPAGLLGKIAGVPRCEEPAANAGSCPADSQIGTATSSAGAGSDPYVVSGPVYLTSEYKGAPFGLSIAVPAKAGPFNLGTVIVRAAIHIDKQTSALTVTSDPLPQSIDGVPFRLKQVKVAITRHEFMFNPTSCEAKKIGATLTGQPTRGEGAASSTPSAPFSATGCKELPFNPTFSMSTDASTSKQNGARLNVLITQRRGEADIQKVKLQLPLALPSRLNTLQQACPSAQFEANPANCSEHSIVGSATAVTPLLAVPLKGPAYLVSHGGAKFPDLVFLLQGEGVHIELTGNTDIKAGITYSKFETVPDAPISSFETSLPTGHYSLLTAYGNVCEKELIAPVTLVSQNNLQVEHATKIAVAGCPPEIVVMKTRVRAASVSVTVRLTETGTVKLGGRGLRPVTKRLTAGTHTLVVPLSKSGKAAKRHHSKIKLQASLTVGKQVTTKTATVKA